MGPVLQSEYIQAGFDRQVHVAIENLGHWHAVVGDRPTVIQTNGSDFGPQNGPSCSVAKDHKLYLPYQKRVIGWIHRHTNWKTLMHCCDGITPLLDSVVEAEFDILNPVRCFEKGMNARPLKQRYGKRLVFWGGVNMPFARSQEVRKRAKVFAPGGGFGFSTIHNSFAHTPLENIFAVFKVLKEYRK